MTDHKELEELKMTVESQLNIKNIFKDSRKREYIYARAVFFSLARKVTVCTFQAIADFANKNHASVVNAVRIYRDAIAPYQNQNLCLRYIRVHDSIVDYYYKEMEVDKEIQTYDLLNHYRDKYYESLDEIEKLRDLVEHYASQKESQKVSTKQ